MASGKVKKIVAEKGFGFICPDDGGNDVFFHHSSLAETKIEHLATGDSVTYDVDEGREGKGPRAVNVVKV